MVSYDRFEQEGGKVTQNATILLVDDDVALLASLSLQLEDAGYSVLKAGDIVSGERLAVEHLPDLVLLEVDSERGAGWLLLERLVSLRPVIVLSGLGLEEQVVRGIEAGAADYLTKPYRSAELLARVRARLNESRPKNGMRPKSNGLPDHRVEAGQRAAQPALTTPAATTVVAAEEAVAAAAGQEVAEGAVAEPAVTAGTPAWVGLADSAAAPPERTLLSQQRSPEEEPVFIDIASEARLLAAEGDAPGGQGRAEDDLAEMTLGMRLNAARRRRHISLVQAENDTRIRMWYLQAMEDEKFALLPRGEASEQLVRSYAQYLGVDTARAVEEYRTLHFNPPVQPLKALGGAPQLRKLPRWPLLLLAVVLALIVSLGAIILFDPVGAQALGESIVSWVNSLLRR